MPKAVGDGASSTQSLSGWRGSSLRAPVASATAQEAHLRCPAQVQAPEDQPQGIFVSAEPLKFSKKGAKTRKKQSGRP